MKRGRKTESIEFVALVEKFAAGGLPAAEEILELEAEGGEGPACLLFSVVIRFEFSEVRKVNKVER
jgi:hypothetical protein